MRAVAVSALVWLAGCNCSPKPRTCTPGDSSACAASSGCAGTQVCNASRTYDPCVCAPVDGGAGGGVDGGAADAGPSLGATHVGVAANTCCLVALGGREALYLANPLAGSAAAGTPAVGELHVVDASGRDAVLAAQVPAFGYGFVPSGDGALFVSSADAGDARLGFAAFPSLAAPPSLTTLAPHGFQVAALAGQGAFTPSGNYFLAQSPAPSVGLLVVDVRTGQVAFAAPESTGSLATHDDWLVFLQATQLAGGPPVDGLYILDLRTDGGAPSTPTLLDTMALKFVLARGPGENWFAYLRDDRSLHYYDVDTQDFEPIATNVIDFALGPDPRRGPIVYAGNDLSLHVVPRLRPESYALPPQTDALPPFDFSPSQSDLFYFTHRDAQAHEGLLYHAALAANRSPDFLLARASASDLRDTDGGLLGLANVDLTGDLGELVSLAYDGSGALTLARGAVSGDIRVAFPPGGPAPRVASLASAAWDAPGVAPIDGSRALVGALSVASSPAQQEATVDAKVHTGAFGFSDDASALAFAGNAAFDADAGNYVGDWRCVDPVTLAPVTAITVPGVSELGPISGRALFVNAPGASPPGVYLVRY